MKKTYLFLLALMMAVMTPSVLRAQQNVLQEGFESTAAGNIPTGWTQSPVDASKKWAVEIDDGNNLFDPAAAASGVGRIKLVANTNPNPLSGNETMLISPEMNITTLAEPILIFDHAAIMHAGNVVDTLKVYYRLRSDRPWILAASFGEADNWVRDTVSFPSKTASFQIAFGGVDNEARGVVLDNIRMTSRPICKEVSNVEVYNKIHNEAKMRWAGELSATYNVKISTQELLDPATATEADGLYISEVVEYKTNLELNASKNKALASATTYYYYIQSDCGFGDVSDWVSGSFTTACDPVETFATSFDAPEDMACWTAVGQAYGAWKATLPTNVATPVFQGVGSDGEELWYNFWSPEPHSGASALWMNVAGRGEDYTRVYAVSPRLADNVNLKDMQLTFWMKSNTKKLHLRVIVTDWPDDFSNAQDAGEIRVRTENAYEPFTLTFEDITSTGKYVAFMIDGSEEYIGNSPQAPAVNIDDVVLETLQPCSSETKVIMFSDPEVTGSTAKLSWNRSGAAKWNVKVSTSSINPGTDPGVIYDDVVETPELTLSGLSSATRYFYYVQPICADEVLGTWSNAQSFDTECIADGVELPFRENFDKYEVQQFGQIELPPCWSSKIPAGSAQRVYITSSNYANSLYNYVSCYPDGMSYVITPKINANLKDCQLRFAYSIGELQVALEVGIMEDPNDDATFKKITEFTMPEAGSYNDYKWQETTVRFEEYTGAGQYVAFRFPTAGVSYRLDDIVVEDKSSCGEPTDFVMQSASTNAITLNWTPSDNNETEWNIAYGKAGAVLGMNTTEVTGITTVPYELTGLEENTVYDIYLRSVCGEDALGRWIGPIQAKTNSPATVPYFCDFEDASMAGAWNLENGIQDNQWIVGNAVAAENNNTGKALYISNDYGMSNAAAPTETFAYACRLLDLEAGMYDFEFDWRLNGIDTTIYSSYWGTDTTVERAAYILPFLVPADIEIEGGQYTDLIYQVSPEDPYRYDWSRYDTEGWILLSDSILITADEVWQHYKKTYQLRKSGRYNLVFAYRMRTNNSHKPAAIDNVKVEANTTTCLTPEDMRVFDITQNSAKIEFLCYNADQWEVKLSTDTLKTIDEINAAQMGDEGIVYIGNQNTNPLVLTGLSPETRYFAYFRPTCGTDQDWAEVEFRTICEAYDVPLEYTFDDLEENSFLTCWRSMPETFKMGWGGPAAPAVYVGKFSPYDEINQTNLTNMLIFATTYSSDGVYATTPELIPDVKALQVSFRLASKIDMAQYALELQVGVMSDPLDESTFELIETIQPRYAGQWKTYNVYFDSYEGNARHIAFRMPTINNYSGYLYVDDLKIDSISGCVPPREITVENVTGNSADISWRVVGEVGSYHVKVTTEPLGRWEDEANVFDDKVVGDNKLQLTGLRSAKMYYVYVRTDCGDGTYSDGMSEINFRTGCGLTEVLPYYEDFETYDLNDVPACWTLVQNPSGYGTRLISMDYTTMLGETVKSLGKLSLSINSDRLKPGMIALPAVEENISELSIMFKGMQGFSADHLVVGVISDLTNPETFVPVDTINLSVMDKWFDCTVDFASYTGTGKNIAFFVASSYFGSSFTVDNVMIRKTAMTCPDATVPQVLNVTSTSATVRWADNPSVSAFEVKVASDEINPEIDRGDVMDGESFGTLSAVLENLDPAKEYYVYLRNVCDDESAGYWSEGVSFRTQCADPETIPYDEDFTGYGEIADQGFFPACWRSRLITYGSISPADQSEPYIENSTRPSLFMKAIYDEKDNSYAVVDAATPAIAFGEANVGGYYMEVTIKSNEKEGRIYVGMMSDPSDASTFVAYDTLRVNTANEWETHVVNFLYHEGTEKHIAFRINSLDAKKTFQVNITDIHVDVLPDCMPPFRVRADIRPNKAFITWMPGDKTNNEWKYYYSDGYSKMTIPFTDEEWETANASASTNVSAVTTERKLTINGLKDWTSYYFYIKTTACGKFYSQPIDLSSRPTCNKMTEEDLPYVADFTINGFGTEDPFYSAFFDCWKREDGYVTDPVSYPYIAEDTTLYYKSVADTVNFAYLPGVATGADTLIAKTQLRFTAKALTENAQALVGVGIYYTEGYPAQDFFEYFPFDTITLTQDWQEYVVKFEGFEWENDWSKSYKDIRVALGVEAGGEYKVNALTWELIPYCYIPEMTLKSCDKTNFSVEWEQLDDQERWEVTYGEVGFVPEEGNIIARTETSYTVVNLEEGTPYEFYLRSNCGNGMNSEWGKLSVTTKQTPATYPYASNDLSDGTVIDGDTLYYAYRTVDMPAGPHKLSFDWKLAADANAWLRVFVVPDSVMFTGDSDFGLTKTEQPESWTAVATLAGETSWKSTTQDMYVAKANEGPVHILFVWTQSGSDVTEVVRNISMSASTECTVPEALSATQVTSTSAVLGWVSYNANAWDLNYYETSNPLGTQTILDVQPGYVLNGLKPDTEYTFSVQSQCKPGIYSESYTFRTICAPVDELYETFDAGSFDNCWKQYHGLIDEVDVDPNKLISVDQGWEISTRAMLGSTGTPHAKLTVAGADCANWLVSPAVKLTENSALSFDLSLTVYKGDGAISNPNGQADDKFMVVISEDEGKTWKKTNAVIWNNEKDQNKTYNRISNLSKRIEVDLSAYTGKTIRVGFYGESTVELESNDIHIDSVRIDCRIPKVLNKETCQGYSYYRDGFEIPKTETEVPGLFEFTRVAHAVNGCDTTYILNLTIKPGKVTEYDRKTCSNELYSDENFSFATLEEMKTGTYTKTFAASNGCDSLVIMNLVVNPSYEYDRNLTISEDDLPFTYECYLFPVGTQSGKFEIECTTAESCDSIIHLNLTVLPGTGIDEVSTGGALVLTPNPVDRGKIVTAEYDFTVAEQRDLRVEIYNNLGMLISVSNPVGMPIALKAPEVSGVYTVRIITGTKDTYIGKFIVK